MSSLFFLFVYFTLDDVYKVKAVFLLVLVRTTGQHKFNILGHWLFFLTGSVILMELCLQKKGFLELCSKLRSWVFKLLDYDTYLKIPDLVFTL